MSCAPTLCRLVSEVRMSVNLGIINHRLCLFKWYLRTFKCGAVKHHMHFLSPGSLPYCASSGRVPLLTLVANVKAKVIV